jgi:hypothetical protein
MGFVCDGSGFIGRSQKLAMAIRGFAKSKRVVMTIYKLSGMTG